MATERTCTEIVPGLQSVHADMVSYVKHAARRHVGFVVLEDLLREAPDGELTVTLKITNEADELGDRFTAHGQVVKPGA
jgi:hypothetical protein